MSRVVGIAGIGRGASLDLGGRATYRIGSNPMAELRIADSRLAPLHARIERRKDGIWIVDLGGREGTFVNGAGVHERRLRQGDVVRIGGTWLRWMAEEGDAGGGRAPTGTLADRLRAYYQAAPLQEART